MRRKKKAGAAKRFSRKALFVSASALCFPLVGSALAGPLENTPFVSMYGGFLFNESGDVIDFSGDTYMNGIGALAAGETGGTAGFEAGRPLSAGWDMRASLDVAAFSDDHGGDSTGDGESALAFQHLDLELGYRPGIVPGGMLRLFAGPRLLHAGQDIDSSFDNGSGKVGTYERDVDLWAAGLRAGAETNVPFGGSRFSLSLMGAGSALYGHVNASYTYDYTAFGTFTGRDSRTDNRGVYSLEGRAAVNFAASDRVDLQVGYQVQQWWNMTTDFGGVTYTDTTMDAGNSGDVLVHGPFARLTVKLP